MRILFIDDMFNRCVPLLQAGHDVFVTRDIETVRTYLEHCVFDVICLDHDLKRSWTGYDIANMFFLNKKLPIIIHSMNPKGAKRISELLTTHGVKHKVTQIYSNDFLQQAEAFVMNNANEI